MTWETDFLVGIGAPTSQSNVFACDKWAESEGTLVDNNPFAVSGRYLGAVRCIAQCGTPSEVWTYDSIENGVAATLQFIAGSNYDAVRAAFQQDAGLTAIYEAINSSLWCAGCQGGHYPVKLYNALPPTQEDDMAIAATTPPNDTQRHVYRENTDGTVQHWWQDTTGPNAGHWNGPETLP